MAAREGADALSPCESGILLSSRSRPIFCPGGGGLACRRDCDCLQPTWLTLLRRILARHSGRCVGRCPARVHTCCWRRLHLSLPSLPRSDPEDLPGLRMTLSRELLPGQVAGQRWKKEDPSSLDGRATSLDSFDNSPRPVSEDDAKKTSLAREPSRKRYCNPFTWSNPRVPASQPTLDDCGPTDRP
jgi:hypothetical protein